jgi:hypothetical protein
MQDGTRGPLEESAELDHGQGHHAEVHRDHQDALQTDEKSRLGRLPHIIEHESCGGKQRRKAAEAWERASCTNRLQLLVV